MRYLIALAALCMSVLAGPPATAGGWAATIMDPVPSRFEAGTSYTLGFWVLQHGTHTYEGELGAVGLRFTGADGKATGFSGTALKEDGHFAAAIALPAGTYTVDGVQGLFGHFKVGTLTVPGALTVIKRAGPDPGQAGGDQKWGAVKPPYLVSSPEGGGGEVTDWTAFGQGGAPAPAVTGAPAAAEAPPADEEVSSPEPLLWAGGGVAVLVAVAALVAVRRRSEPAQELLDREPAGSG